jgi:hypothetical protein
MRVPADGETVADRGDKSIVERNHTHLAATKAEPTPLRAAVSGSGRHAMRGIAPKSHKPDIRTTRGDVGIARLPKA